MILTAVLCVIGSIALIAMVVAAWFMDEFHDHKK